MTGVDFCTFGLASFSLVYWSGAAWSALRMGAVKEVDSLPPVTLPRWPPPASLIGQRIAIHAGAHIGGRKAAPRGRVLLPVRLLVRSHRPV